MGLLGKIFGGGSKKSTATVETITVECPHAVLVPRWENVQDMGIEAKATRWMCESCKSMFTPDEANMLRATLAERVVLEAPPAEEETKSDGGV
jgi:hypothetical protein